jgi:hypothetical protein
MEVLPVCTGCRHNDIYDDLPFMDNPAEDALEDL